MKNPIATIFALLIFLATAFVAPCSGQVTVQIVNNSGLMPQDVYLLLTGDPSKPLTVTGITANQPTQLSELKSNQFTLSAISAGRLIVSYNGPVPANQQPLNSSYRFDKVELTYPGAANLTAVDFFGIPFKLETFDSTTALLEKLTYYTSTNTLLAQLEAIAKPEALITTNGMSNGPFARILAPALSPTSYPDMTPYVDSVAGTKLTISGTYVGPVGPNPNSFSYSGMFEPNGTIALFGTMTQPATPADKTLTIDGNTLPSAIYTDNGPYTVDTATNNPQNVSNNDVYAAIYRDVVAGFDFGYVNGVYGINSGEWYGTTPYNPPYACARQTNDGFYNKYASLIAANSDAYGFPFSDLLQPVQVALNPGTSKDVATLRITILPDNMLDAPIIQGVSTTTSSVKLTWKAVTGATDYKVNVSPPLPAEVYDAGTATSYTVTSLDAGTPYTVSVTASNATATSEAISALAVTQGTARLVTGAASWHFIVNFTGSFPGDKITFNGVTEDLPSTLNPAIPFNDVTGVPGQTNAYVFLWKDTTGKTISTSIMYVNLKSTPTTGMGAINEAASATYMVANQNRPTYDPTGFNLYLSIAPTVQRTLCTTTLARR
jgi:hypothetical protein